MMDDKLIQIELYEEPSGNCPYENWFDGLKDRKSRFVISNRLNRVMLGNFGDHKSVGQGVYELRIAYGSGYRIYFGMEGKRLIILLVGGDKGTQARDIKKARQYWVQYKERTL